MKFKPIHLCAIAGLLVACGGGNPPPQTAPTEPPQTAPTQAPSETPLYLALSKLAPPGEVLEALSEAQRAQLDRYVSAVTPEQRELLLAGEDPVIASRPILYLAVGGQDLRYVELFYTSNAASNELVILAAEAGDEDNLPALSRELASRAALHVLQMRTADVSAQVEHHPEHLEQIAFAAHFTQLTEIERLALDELSRTESPAKWHLALARLAAERLDIDAAEAQLTRAEGVDPKRLESVRAKVSAARVALTEPTTNDQRVAAARAFLTLGNPKAAVDVLDPIAPLAEENLAVATTLLRAEADGSACPKLPPSIANEHLCQRAWAETFAAQPLQTLETAWNSKQGRDVAAVEAFLGLAYVVPLMYGLTPQGAPATPDSVRDGFEALRAKAQEAAPLDPAFSGMELLAHALGLAIEAAGASGGGRAVIAAEQRTALMERAKQMSLRDDAWGQAAALGVAGIVSQDESTRSIVDNLKGHVAVAYETTLGALLLWDLLADADKQRFDYHKPLLAEIAQSGDSDSFDRSKWLFTWAEAEAHLLPSPRSYATLRSICEKLIDPRVPLGLRLRAHLNLAGLDARAGNLEAAIQQLHPIVVNTPRSMVSTHDEQELLIAATGYLLVLRGLSTQADERQEYVKKLEGLLLDVGRSSAAPPTLQMWLVAWRAEFDKLTQLNECKGRKTCEDRVRKARPLDAEKLGQAIGQRSAALLKAGVVPVGGVQVEFRFDARGRLEPLIEISPQFLLLHVPPL